MLYKILYNKIKAINVTINKKLKDIVSSNKIKVSMCIKKIVENFYQINIVQGKKYRCIIIYF